MIGNNKRQREMENYQFINIRISLAMSTVIVIHTQSFRCENKAKNKKREKYTKLSIELHTYFLFNKFFFLVRDHSSTGEWRRIIILVCTMSGGQKLKMLIHLPSLQMNNRQCFVVQKICMVFVQNLSFYRDQRTR